jgi:hypothetical protein
VTYTLSGPATVKFRVKRRARGRRVGKRCVKATKRNRGKRRCSRYANVRGSFTRRGVAGHNRFRFSGRLGGKKLEPGRYRLVAVARDANGKSRARRARFTIVGPARR